MARYRAVRGTFDLLPKQMPVWVKVESQARELAKRFGFGEMRTPLFEQAEIFTRGMGVMAGLVEKELWTFQDKFGQKLALRADMTAGVARAFQEHKFFEGTLPVKVFYLGPVFLLGKEGEEGSRQSHQFGVEALGCGSAALDAEVISLAAAFCQSVGLDGYCIRLNSLGGADCRSAYQVKLRNYLASNQDQLCPTCKRKFKTHPDWVLSCAEEGCKALASVAPTIFGMLSNGAKQHFSSLREYLEDMDLPVELDPWIVPDSEYYNQTVFEIRHGDQTIGLGGRYDGLVEKLGGKSTPAVGFALSLETVVDILAQRDAPDEPFVPKVYFQSEGLESSKILVPLLGLLRQRGIAAEFDYRIQGRSSPPQGCSYVVLLDESNAFRGYAVLKDLNRDKEEKIPVGRLRSRLLQLLNSSSEPAPQRIEVSGSSEAGGTRRKLRRGTRRVNEDRVESKGEGTDAEASATRDKGGRRSRLKPQDDSSFTREDELMESGVSESDNGEGSRDTEREGDTGVRRRIEPASRDARERSKSVGGVRRDREVSRKGANDEHRGEGDGKALIPAFHLGGTATKLGASKDLGLAVKKREGIASTASNAVLASGAGQALNWSLLPIAGIQKQGGADRNKKGEPAS